MELGHYAPFVIGSYALTFAAMGALIVNAILAERKQQRALAKLEAQGIRRRSEATRQKNEQ